MDTVTKFSEKQFLSSEIIYQLDLQDELDRAQVALFGVSKDEVKDRDARSRSPNETINRDFNFSEMDASNHVKSKRETRDEKLKSKKP